MSEPVLGLPAVSAISEAAAVLLAPDSVGAASETAVEEGVITDSSNDNFGISGMVDVVFEMGLNITAGVRWDTLDLSSRQPEENGVRHCQDHEHTSHGEDDARGEHEPPQERVNLEAG